MSCKTNPSRTAEARRNSLAMNAPRASTDASDPTRSGNRSPVSRTNVIGFVIVLLLLDILLLATWVPHYLTWPWWPDTDAFAVLAQSWQAGILPYRDIAAFNFPGQTYVMWLFGSLFGWGRTSPFYALDATLVVTLGLALILWSRRCFGSILPGLVGYTAFLGYYLDLDYTQVAQRDWHAPLLLVLGLLTLQSWPGRWSLVASAALTAIAVAFRPHVVLLLPAIAIAIHYHTPRTASSWPQTFHAWLVWALAFGGVLLLAFAPLILAGIFDDFVRSILRTATEGRYTRATWLTAVAVFFDQFHNIRLSIILLAVSLATILTLGSNPSPARVAARIWSIALLGTLLYKSIHPVYHDYLQHPSRLVAFVNLAALTALLLEQTSRWKPITASAAMIPIIALANPGIPSYCSVAYSIDALPLFKQGSEPAVAPLGYTKRKNLPNAAHYPWADYRALLNHLRKTTGPRTQVANCLKAFPAVNGAVGRLSPFPVESGLVFVWLMGPTVEEQFATALEQTPDSVVVWIPNEEGPVLIPMSHLSRLIQDLYQPQARFGKIQVWRRRPGL
jgi:hypothetical protein